MPPPPAVPPPPSPLSAAPYGFAGVAMGSPQADLARVRPKAICSPPVAGAVECRAPDQPLGGGFFARELVYRYTGGRLSEIRFHSSIDGFAFVVARLKQDFGAPSDILRDYVILYRHSFDHVRFTWRNGRSRITLSDPDTLNQLALRMNFETQPQPAAGRS